MPAGGLIDEADRRKTQQTRPRWSDRPRRRGRCGTSVTLETNRDCARSTLLEEVMAAHFASTFLACGGIFLLAFFMIWAFWFIERMRGASAPRLGKSG